MDAATHEDAVPQAAPRADSAGARLAAAREARGLSVEDVSRQIKLTPVQVQGLENDDYSGLPSIVFVRGFLRSYAKLVGADITALLPGKAAVAPAMPPESAPSSTLQHQDAVVVNQASRHALWWSLTTAACVIGALSYYEFVINTPAPTQPAKAAGAEKAAAETVSAPTPADAATAPAVASAPVPAAREAAGTGAATPVDRNLHFRFKRDSWVEVLDGDDNVILRQRHLADSERRISGKPPFKLVVGAASSVELRYNGTLVDLPAHTRTSDVARLTLE
jgi:cytoskeleton protein RodZ